MSNKASLQRSSAINSFLYQILPSFSSGSRSFLSQFMMISTFLVFLVAFLPYVSSSPTPSSTPIENDNNNNNNNIKVIHDSNAFMFNPIDDQTNSIGDSSESSSSVHEQQISAPSSLFWFGQPRTHANQFLMSHVNDNEVVVPKWYTRFNNNHNNDDADDDDIDDYVPSNKLINKRSSYYNRGGGHQTLKKFKQFSKPPMEVMNEIVNSIYLKR